ncbi:hypothetical protein pb186bvf_005564 [Paramecium bursaria]
MFEFEFQTNLQLQAKWRHLNRGIKKKSMKMFIWMIPQDSHPFFAFRLLDKLSIQEKSHYVVHLFDMPQHQILFYIKSHLYSLKNDE